MSVQFESNGSSGYNSEDDNEFKRLFEIEKEKIQHDRKLKTIELYDMINDMKIGSCIQFKAKIIICRSPWYEIEFDMDMYYIEYMHYPPKRGFLHITDVLGNIVATCKGLSFDNKIRIGKNGIEICMLWKSKQLTRNLKIKTETYVVLVEIIF